eukprot:TRINITY_DN1088_c0_g1_i1.p1 TRINITY_DN1088_c0_g1~~TRINITY_DN1088_c0_g1_i1.p1  ORF type:complete len:241 (+),score=35.54 TRINITY_DN1088_c0_g1_i1:124-846(+)
MIMRKKAVILLGLCLAISVSCSPLGPGRKVFFDFGTNDGQSTEFFFGTTRNVKDIPRLGGKLDSPIFGMGSHGAWEVHLFEANPRFHPQLLALKTTLLTSHPRTYVNVYNGTAISTADGEATFYLDDKIGREGATLIANHRRNFPVVVKTYGITTLFKDLYLQTDDYVVVKMDIEGAEFPVLIEVVSKGLLPLIDVLAVEWHDMNPTMNWGEPLKRKLTSQKECLQLILQNSNVQLLNWA